MFETLYRFSTYFVCCDGASNRLYDRYQSMEGGGPIPTHIVGDLDSAKPEVIDFYKDKGVTCIANPEDQDSTDLQKSIRCIVECIASNPFIPNDESKNEYRERNDKIIILFPFGGRIDHTLGSMHTLCKLHAETYPTTVEYILMDETSTMQCLGVGENIILPSKIQSNLGCGVIPLMGKCTKIKTSGLRWNMDYDNSHDKEAT